MYQDQELTRCCSNTSRRCFVFRWQTGSTLLCEIM